MTSSVRVFLLVLVAGLATAAVLSAAAPGASAFPSRTTYDRILSAPGDGEMAIGDVNGDGKPDAVVIDGDRATLSVFLQGGGGLPTSPSYSFQSPAARRVVLADVDGDGATDIAALGTNSTRLYFQDGGTFGQRVSEVVMPGAKDLAVADLNGDALPDLAAISSALLEVWFQKSAPASWSTEADLNVSASGFHGILAADLVRDGRADLVLAKSYELRVYPQTLEALQLTPVSVILDGFGGFVVAQAGALDGDDLLDIVIAETDPVIGGRITVYVQQVQPEGTFVNGGSLSGALGTRVALGDVNDDGATDLVAGETGPSIAVYLQRFGGGFDGSPSFALTVEGGLAPTSIAAGRFSGRAYLDVLVRVPGALLLFEQDDLSPVMIQAVPSTFVFNVGTSGAGLIDLRNYFRDDHGHLAFAITYQEASGALRAEIAADGYHMDFTAAPGWYGEARFQVAATDGAHGPVLSNAFTVTVNVPPSITSEPELEARTGGTFRYQVAVEDPFPLTDRHTFSLLEAPAGMAIDPRTGLVEWTPSEGDAGGHVVRIRVQDAFGGAVEQVFEVQVIVAPRPVPVAAYAAAGAASVFAALGLGSLASENLKYSLLALFVPLYSKIKREQVLDHFVRGQIYGYIMANPGEHYNAIKVALHLTNGSLAHHLKTLEREQFLKSKRFGLYRRFYPMHMRIPEEGFFAPNEIQKTIVELIRATPGITQKEIAERLGLTPPTVNYHVGILSGHRAIRVERAGRKTHCFVHEGLPPPPTALNPPPPPPFP